MATIGTLAVSLVAKADQFLSGLSKAEAAVGKFTGSIPGLNMVLSKTGALLGALAGGALAAYMHSTAEAVDHTAKLADRLGTSTEKLVGLQHAAELAGGGQEQLDAALGKLSKGLGAAAEDSGTAEKGLAAIGLRLDELIGKDPATQFGMIADGISGLATQEQKAAAAADLFGKSGNELVNVLDLGSKGLAAMQADAEKLGLTFSRVDAAKVEQANDALHRVHDVVTGALQSAVIAIAPYIEGLANAFVDWATEGEGAGVKVVAAVEWVAAAIAKLTGVVQFLYGTGKMLVGSVGQAFVEIEGAIGEVVSTLADLVRWIPGLEGKFEWVDDWSRSQEERHKAMGDMAADGERLIQTSDDLSTATTAWFEKMKTGAQQAAAATADHAAAQRALAAAQGPGAVAAAAAAADEAKEHEKTTKQLDAQRKSLETRVAEMERVNALSVDDRKWATEILRIEEARAAGWTDLADRMQAVLDVEQASAAADEIDKKVQAQQDLMSALAGEITQRERVAALSKDDKAFATEILEIEHARAMGWDDLASKLEVLLQQKRDELKLAEQQKSIEDERKKAADEAARKAQAQADLGKSLRDELELLRAGNDLERERVRIAQELADNLEKAAGNQANMNAAQQVAAEKLKAADEDAAARAAKASGASEGGGGGTRSADQGDGNQDGSHLAGRHKKAHRTGTAFSSIAGGVVVGPERLFGAGGPTREEYNAKLKNDAEVAWMDRKAAWAAAHPEARVPQAPSPAATTATGAAGATAAGSGASAMPDPSPALAAATQAATSARDSLQKVVDGIGDLGKAIEALSTTSEEGARSTADVVQRVGDAVADVKAEVKRMIEANQKVAAAMSGA